MTILIGAIDNENKQIVVGSDTQWTWAGDYSRDMGVGSKFVLDWPEQGLLMVGAGEESYAQLAQEVADSKPWMLQFKSKKDVVAFGAELRNVAKENGVGDPKENSMPCHMVAYIIGYAPTKKIYLIDDDYSVLEFDTHICSGCGSAVSEPVYEALRKMGHSVHESVSLAIEGAIDHDIYCGGQIDIKTIPFGDQ